VTELARAHLVIHSASEVRTCDPAIGEGNTGLIRNGAVAVAGDFISWVGKTDDLHNEVSSGYDTITIDASGKTVIPGFVDAHTHLVFAGDRREEFSARAGGRPYEAGGILQTVLSTRAASTADLVGLSMKRADQMLAHGTTTAEAKTGYALDLDGERKLLEVLAEVNRSHDLDLEITFLGAHALPPEFVGRSDDYIDHVGEMLDDLSMMAGWCDVFCDVGAFTPDQSRRVLELGKRHGLRPRIHANELAASGGAGVAAEVEAASADHLIHLDEQEAKALAATDCVGVLCPVTALGLERFPDTVMMREQGMTIALASDLNPGTAHSENIQLAIAIATRAMSMTPEDALIATTRSAALSLKREDVGRLSPGGLGDIAILSTDSALDLGYHAGVNLVEQVIKRGLIIDPNPASKE
jgi:imidazolonepropionase